MALPDGVRQVLAGVLAALAFLALYFPLALVWWVALPLAMLVYFALLLVIRRARPLSEIALSDGVNAGQIRDAAAALATAARRLEALLPGVPEADRATVAQIAGHLGAIRANLLADPADYRTVRRFVTSFLPLVLDSVEAYAALAARLAPADHPRLAEMGVQIRALAAPIAEIDRATLANDFDKLEVQLSVLAGQMNRGAALR